MDAQDIRSHYLQYFIKRQHALIPRAQLVPQDDATTLFTGSGMQPLVPYLLGETHPKGKRLVNSQTCLRAQDIEDIGDNRHTTFFEMLGNWSLGDYFKEDQLRWFFTFLTDEVGLDPNKLYVTCFIGSKQHGIPRDDESATIWSQLFEEKGIDAPIVEIGSQKNGDLQGMKNGRIFFYDDSENWWSRGGGLENTPIGDPCGPDSEVFYDFGEAEHDATYGLAHPASDSGRFMEIGNQVFMQFRRTQDGFEPLATPNVDFGGGLERIAAASINSPDVFKVSVMWPIVQSLEQLSGKSYESHTVSMRVIVDHIRAAVFLALDGVRPSNKEHGYVMRRLVRRAIRFAFELGIEQNFIEKVTPVITDVYQQDFPEVATKRDEIFQVLIREEKTFRQTLRKAIRVFDKEITKMQGSAKNHEPSISGSFVFSMYDTYGFPVELTLEEAYKRGINVAPNWNDEFESNMKQQRQRSQTAAKGTFKGGLEGDTDIHKKYHTATHLLYKALREVLGAHVVQRGSNITNERLRFDFSHPQKVTKEQQEAIEHIVNQAIEARYPMTWEEYPTDEAIQKGALGAFGDTYGDTVKVYSAGHPHEPPFSFEICGGPHVSNTGDLADGGKQFAIIKEEASSAGVRRIKAVLKDSTE